MSCGSKIYSKMHFVSCTITYHDVTDLVSHGMVKNTKTWISWEMIMTFLRDKKTLNMCLKCTNTYHDVTDLMNHRMVKHTKTWTSWE